jgi:DNA-binding NtrC family response regulator
MENRKTCRPADQRSVLVIDDEEGIGSTLKDLLKPAGIQVHGVGTGREALATFQKSPSDLILLDLNLQDVCGATLMRDLLRMRAATDVVVMTGNHSMEKTVDVIRRGALDYIVKPCDPQRLAEKVLNWMETRSARNHGDNPIAAETAAVGIVGESDEIHAVAAKIFRIGPHFRNGLVTGPTGCGKELAARLLHRASGRSGPFVVFNCAAVPASLFESELFGHVKGAFTGAAQDRIGIAEHASGGTLFIDEVGDLTLPMQAALLRLVQNRESKRLGSAHVRTLDIRIVAATNKDLRRMVETKHFREDLYHRLSTAEVAVPALSVRDGDISILAKHFVAALCGRYGRKTKTLSPAALDALNTYSWPGNVRELESAMDYCCLMCPTTEIDRKDLPEFVLRDEEEGGSLEAEELRHLTSVLEWSGGNREKTAQTLEIGRATLYRMLARRATRRSKT